MPDVSSDGLVLVLTSPLGASYTFLISGTVWKLVGPGVHPGDGIMAKARTFEVQAGPDVWTFELIPTQAMLASFVTFVPARNAILTALLICTSAVIFWVYEVLVNRRAASMNLALARTAASLTSARANVMATALSSAHKDQFVAMVSHEIRTPLNAVSGAVTLLRGSSSIPRTPSVTDLLEILDSGSTHVVQIVDNILDQAGAHWRPMATAGVSRALSRLELSPSLPVLQR